MANDKKVSMRGWGRIKMASTRLSTLAEMRRNYKLILDHWKDSTPCMWNFELRTPPSKKTKRASGGQ
jgi:hypothetical protein